MLQKVKIGSQNSDRYRQVVVIRKWLLALTEMPSLFLPTKVSTTKTQHNAVIACGNRMWQLGLRYQINQLSSLLLMILK